LPNGISGLLTTKHKCYITASFPWPHYLSIKTALHIMGW